jgi:conjugal transfer pilus assembly protein TraD
MDTYTNPWRPNYEAAGVAWWLGCTVIAWFSAPFWALHEAPFRYLALAGLLMAMTWLPGAVGNWQRMARLRGQPQAFMRPDELRQRVDRAPQDIWLGWGFEWQAGHAQLVHDLLRIGPEQVVASLGEGMGAQWIHGLGETEQDIRVPLSHVEGHMLVVGTTGAGKTRLFDLLVTQAVDRGEAVVIIDPKGDQDLRACAERACGGDPERFVYFHPAFPNASARIDPLASFNRATEPASRVAALIPSETGNDPFKAFAQMAMIHVIAGLLLVEDRPSLVALRRYLEGGIDALMERAIRRYCDERVPNWEAEARRYLGSATDQARRAAGMLRFYQERVRETHPSTVLDGLADLFVREREHFGKMVASLMPILIMLTTGDLGPLLSPRDGDGDPRPRTSLAEAIRQGQVVYIGLDSLSDAMVGAAIGSILLADLATVAGDRYNAGAQVAPCNVFVDEAAEVVNDPFIQILNKGRGARLRLTIATQTFADFAARTGSEAKARQVLGNINNMVVLRALDAETQEYVTESLPKTTVRSIMAMQGSNSSGTDPLLFTGSVSERINEEEADLFPAAILGHLPNFHYIARFAGGRIVKGRLPILGEPKN